MKILLIGNGPSATENEWGNEIDRFPLVVRFNSYRIPRYEKHVGTKTDIWVTTDIFKPWHKDYLEVILCSFARTKDNPLFKKLVEFYPDLKMFPEWAWQEAFKETGYHAPSTGAVTTIYFKRNFEVYLYGFDFFNANKHHYGDNQEIGKNHKPDLEKAFFKALLDKGEIKMWNPKEEI